MKKARLFLTASQVGPDTLTPSKENFHHLKTVLRLQKGDCLDVVILGQDLLTCRIKEITKDRIYYARLSQTTIKEKTTPKITIAQSLPKGDKLSDVLNQCCQLSLDHFIVLKTTHCIPKLTPQQFEKKHRRWSTILHSAAMQSQRTTIPTLSPQHMTLHDLISWTKTQENFSCLLLNEFEKNHRLKTVLETIKDSRHLLLLIGPEGGWDQTEIDLLTQNGCHSISLGNTILRTELAGPAVLAMITYAFS